MSLVTNTREALSLFHTKPEFILCVGKMNWADMLPPWWLEFRIYVTNRAHVNYSVVLVSKTSPFFMLPHLSIHPHENLFRKFETEYVKACYISPFYIPFLSCLLQSYVLIIIYYHSVPVCTNNQTSHQGHYNEKKIKFKYQDDKIIEVSKLIPRWGIVTEPVRSLVFHVTWGRFTMHLNSSRLIAELK